MARVTAYPTIGWVRPSQPFTKADLERMPDDGHRYELVDGVLVVTPGPSVDHQDASGNLFVLLKRHCPPGLRVVHAPFDVDLTSDTRVQPDLLVAERSHFHRGNLPEAPLLAVEILSPSTRHIDLGLKFSRYQAAACPSYWVVDPEEPSVTVWELTDGAYAQVVRARGGQRVTVNRPFPLSIVPEELLI